MARAFSFHALRHKRVDASRPKPLDTKVEHREADMNCGGLRQAPVFAKNWVSHIWLAMVFMIMESGTCNNSEEPILCILIQTWPGHSWACSLPCVAHPLCPGYASPWQEKS